MQRRKTCSGKCQPERRAEYAAKYFLIERLFIYQKIDHQTGSGEVGNFPWEAMGEPAPWDGDERLKSAYMADKKSILSKGETGLVKKSINYPADNLTTTTDIVRKVKVIARGENGFSHEYFCRIYPTAHRNGGNTDISFRTGMKLSFPAQFSSAL